MQLKLVMTLCHQPPCLLITALRRLAMQTPAQTSAHSLHPCVAGQHLRTRLVVATAPTSWLCIRVCLGAGSVHNVSRATLCTGVPLIWWQ